MNYFKFVIHILYIFISSLGWFLTIIPPILFYYLCSWISNIANINQTSFALICFGVLQIFIFLRVLQLDYQEELRIGREKIAAEKNLLIKETEAAKKALQDKEFKFEIAIAEENRKVEKFKQTVCSLLQSKQPFKDCSKLVADLKSLTFDEVINSLKKKRHPALRAAEVLKDYKKKFHEAEYMATVYESKIEYLCNIFPEIAEYIENEAYLIDLSDFEDYSELEEYRDRTKDYLTPEEYAVLQPSERNQIALDRYLSKPKTPQQIGRDYEMSCSYMLRQKGYYVEETGIKMGIHDLGRDLIASRSLPNDITECLVIQCKCWKKDRIIRENVICQLYGTFISYLIENNINENNKHQYKFQPVIMIPSFSTMSDVALKMCKMLRIKIWVQDHIDYPRIKCNVNKGMKIYHLPFDQQYNRTEIKNKDEFYAYTVKEAESRGFRRAQRHMFKQ